MSNSVPGPAASPLLSTPPLLFAVIVLYKMRAEDSPAWQTLQTSLQLAPELHRSLRYMVCDHTPGHQEAPAGFEGTYHRDASNPGLATAYNVALQAAQQWAAPWLLLLDQDTVLTADYWHEAIDLARQLQPDPAIAAIVPKLVEAGHVLSPHYAATLRHPLSVEADAHGASAAPIYPFNSGALVRVAALQAIGGFPSEFWLDYLDHATFRQLQDKGGRIFVMHASLEHELSSNQAALTPAQLARQRNVLAAEHAFYRRFGSLQERLAYHFRMLRRTQVAATQGQWRRCAMLLKHAVFP